MCFWKETVCAFSNEGDAEVYEALIAIAERRMSKAELAALFRRLFGTE